MLARIYQRRAVASEWAIFNPILAEGEIGLETDTVSFKIGDGVTSWNDLLYASGKSAYSTAVQNGFIGTEEEWLATLDGYGIALENGFSGTKQEWLESLTSYGIAVKNGFVGTEEEWLATLDGYGIAIENGFVGTKQEWLDSLIGPQGETGPQGAGLVILGSYSDVAELPASGNIGDAYIVNTELFIWTGAAWESAGQLGTTAIVSDNVPAGSVTEGTIWFDRANGSTYIYINDGDSSQWVQINGASPLGGTIDGGTPFD